jgi:hypothetical protein
MKPSRLIRPILIWCVTLSLPVRIFFEPVRDIVRILQNPATVEGTVAELRPNDHRSVVISYEVSSRTFTTSTSLPETIGLPRFEDIHVGDRVHINYDPRHSAAGVPGDPKKLLIGTVEDFALVATGLLLFSIALDLYFRRWLLKSRSE